MGQLPSASGYSRLAKCHQANDDDELNLLICLHILDQEIARAFGDGDEER
jgi:hypothetical protein